MCFAKLILRLQNCVVPSDFEFSEDTKHDLRNHFAKVVHLDVSLEQHFITQGQNASGHKFWMLSSGDPPSEIIHFSDHEEDGCKQAHNLGDNMMQNGKYAWVNSLTRWSIKIHSPRKQNIHMWLMSLEKIWQVLIRIRLINLRFVNPHWLWKLTE